MLKGKIVRSGLSDHLAAGWFSIDFLPTLEHRVQKMYKTVLAHEPFICYLGKVETKDWATAFNKASKGIGIPFPMDSLRSHQERVIATGLL